MVSSLFFFFFKSLENTLVHLLDLFFLMQAVQITFSLIASA